MQGMLLRATAAALLLVGATAQDDDACRDDPTGLVASFGFACSEAASFGCDVDMHDLFPLEPGFTEGTMVMANCPHTCNSCSTAHADDTCTAANAATRVDDVMRACCPHDGGGHRRAQDDTPQCDLPEACPSERCAATFISFMGDCQTWMDANRVSLPMIDFYRFRDRCQILSDEQEGRGIVSCTASIGGEPIVPGVNEGTSDGWIWTNLPCSPHMLAADRNGMINPPEDGSVRCTMNWIDGDAVYGYQGPQSAAECAHVLCHHSSGKYIFDTAYWDGEVVATAEAAEDQSETVITSDPNLFCVSCTQTTIDGATAWHWDNLPCEPGMDYEEGRYDADPEGNERCQCHATTNGLMRPFDGPSSAAQCGHLICNNYDDRYTFDYCAWDGNIVATASAGFEESTVLTSDPAALCDPGPVRPTCTHEVNANGVTNWLWSNLPCAPTFERGERVWVDPPTGDERCTCHSPEYGEYAYSGPQSPAECSHVVCHGNTVDQFLFTSCSWDGEVIVTAEQTATTELTITSDPHVMCVTCENNNELNEIIWQNLPCVGTMEYTERDYSADPTQAMCHCHVAHYREDYHGGSDDERSQWWHGADHSLLSTVGVVDPTDLSSMQAAMMSTNDEGLPDYMGITYGGPQNRAQCGHLVCHRGQNPTYVFDYCLWGQITASSGDGSDESPFSYDFSQTVLAASGEHEAYADSQTITSDPELLCVDAEADAVTCRMEHIAADGSGGGWIWDNLPCEPGIDMENRHWDSTPEGTERCICTSHTGSYGDNAGVYAYDGPVSAAQCAHLICHSSGHDNYIFDSCSWDGRVVATAEPDDNQHYTRLTSDPATLCVGIDPDPLGKCKGTWDRPDPDGCVGIVQRGRACRGGEMPCDGLDHIGESWTEEHDANGHYLRAHGEGNFLTYTHDFGTGDFTMTAQMKLFDLDGSAGTFMINDGHFGFEGACQCTFTEGGFFGGVLNTDIDSQCDDADNSGGTLGSGCTDPAEHGFIEGQLMTFRIERRGNAFTFWASEVLVYTYETDVPVTSIGWRPHRATFFLYDWQVVRHG